MKELKAKAWDDGVEWGTMLVMRRPFPAAWGQSALPASPDGRCPVLAIQPRGGGGWLAIDQINDWRGVLMDLTEGCEPDDEWEIRFGMAPIGWTSDLPEHEGW